MSPETQQLLLSLLQGVMSGVILVLIGYVKNTPLEKFEWKTLITKLPIGAVVGLVAAWQKIPFSEALSWATTVGLIAVVDQVIKALLRRFWPAAAALVDVSHNNGTPDDEATHSTADTTPSAPAEPAAPAGGDAPAAPAAPAP